MASTYLTRTPSSTGNKQIFTFSAWVKRSLITSDKFTLLGGYNGDSDTGYFDIRFLNLTDRLNLTGWNSNWLTTTRVFRDVNAWYHIVYAIDTTQATPSNRIKLYVNGIQETAFDVNTEINRNLNLPINTSGTAMIIGRSSYTPSPIKYFNGLMSHVHFIDGTQYDASYFGETDVTTGEWKIKTSPSVTYGTNGFFILKDGNSVTDQSGKGNNFTVGGGTLTKTEDSPSNVFCTMNPLISQTAGVAGRNNPIDAKFFNGNTTIATSVAYWTPQLGNMEMFSGKYYWEQKFEVDGTPSNYLSWIGIEATDTAGTALGNPSGTNANGIAYGTGGVVNKSGSSQSGSWSTWTAGDIVMCAVDLDNNYIYFGKNGTWQNSGVPTSGGSGTGGVAVTTGKSYITASTIHRGGNYSINTTYSYAKSNFGNGYFGTTAVSSAGTNASGNGIFEYDVPTGFTALSTKGLNL